jgi:hypothetical protein
LLDHQVRKARKGVLDLKVMADFRVQLEILELKVIEDQKEITAIVVLLALLELMATVTYGATLTTAKVE